MSSVYFDLNAEGTVDVKTTATRPSMIHKPERKDNNSRTVCPNRGVIVSGSEIIDGPPSPNKARELQPNALQWARDIHSVFLGLEKSCKTKKGTASSSSKLKGPGNPRPP